MKEWFEHYPVSTVMMVISLAVQIAATVAYYAAGNPVLTTGMDWLLYIKTWYVVCELVPGLLFMVSWIVFKFEISAS